jgi:hypothetical protein
LQHAFLKPFRWFHHLHKLTITMGDVCFQPTSSSFKTLASRFNNLDQSPNGAISSAWFKGMTHSESPSLHPILEELPNEDDSASSEGGATVPLS